VAHIDKNKNKQVVEVLNVLCLELKASPVA
jgi:hypothetical protein